MTQSGREFCGGQTDREASVFLAPPLIACPHPYPYPRLYPRPYLSQVYSTRDVSHLLTNVGLYGCAFVAAGLAAASWGFQRTTMRRAHSFVVRRNLRGRRPHARRPLAAFPPPENVRFLPPPPRQDKYRSMASRSPTAVTPQALLDAMRLGPAPFRSPKDALMLARVVRLGRPTGGGGRAAAAATSDTTATEEPRQQQEQPPPPVTTGGRVARLSAAIARRVSSTLNPTTTHATAARTTAAAPPTAPTPSQQQQQQSALSHLQRDEASAAAAEAILLGALRQFPESALLPLAYSNFLARVSGNREARAGKNPASPPNQSVSSRF